MPNNQRRNRINEEVARVVAEALRGVKDPRVREAGMVTVTHAEVAPDLSSAKIFVSLLASGSDAAAKEKELMKGLRSCAGFIRRELSMNIELRITPELTFVLDRSIGEGAHILEIMENISRDE